MKAEIPLKMTLSSVESVWNVIFSLFNLQHTLTVKTLLLCYYDLQCYLIMSNPINRGIGEVPLTNIVVPGIR